MKNWLLYFFLLIPFYSTAQDTLTISVSPEKIKIGEQAKFTIRFRYEAGASEKNIVWPEWKDTIISKIEIIETGEIKTRKPKKVSGNILEKTQELTITSFDSGYHAIPPVQIIVNNDTLYSNPVLFEVHTVSVDTTKEYKAIKDIYETKLSIGDYLRMFGNWVKDNIWWIVAAVLVVLILLYFFWWRKRKKPVEEKPVIIIPPHIIALEQLSALENKKLWQNGMIKEYYIELADILRSYIEKRFLIHAMEQTTDEIMSQLRLTDISEISKLTLVPVLKLSDLVKFAKENPIGTENEEMMQRSKDFITSTIPVKPIKENKS